jgi:hypothetical protein
MAGWSRLARDEDLELVAAWYRESSPIQDLDGRVVAVREPLASELSVPVLPRLMRVAGSPAR